MGENTERRKVNAGHFRVRISNCGQKNLSGDFEMMQNNDALKCLLTASASIAGQFSNSYSDNKSETEKALLYDLACLIIASLVPKYEEQKEGIIDDVKKLGERRKRWMIEDGK